MKELIINGVTVDLDENTRLDIQYVSFLFSDISNISSSRSWTVSLPKTSKNLSLIEYSNTSDYSGSFPYDFSVVNYYQDGINIIKSGKAILTSSKGKRIEFVFTFGTLFEIIKLLKEKKLTELTELSTDFLRWNRSINLNDTATRVKWCNFYSFTNEDRSWTPGSHVDIPYSVLHPSVPLYYLLEKIEETFGITINYNTLNPDISDIYLPLKNKDGISTNAEYAVANEAQRDSTVISTDGIVRFTVVQFMDMFVLVDSYKIKKLEGIKDVSINFDSTIYSSSNNANVRIIIVDKSGVERIHAYYQENADTYTINTTINLLDTDDYFFIKSDLFTQIATASYIYFVPTIKYSYYKSTTNANYGFFPIIPNLPDITCADLLMECCKLTGLFPYIDEDSPTELSFYSVDKLYTNVVTPRKFKNWSHLLVKNTDTLSELSDVEFKFGSYAQKNTLAYKPNETNLLNTSSFLTVDNKTLEDEYKLVELKFAAGKRFSNSDQTIDYPLYDIKIQDGVLVKNAKNQSNDVIAKVVNVNSINYLKFTDDLLFSNIKTTDNYVSYQKIIERPRYLKEKFNLKAYDILKLDLREPIYLNQYGKYYAIMKLQYRDNDFSECELLEIKNI